LATREDNNPQEDSAVQPLKKPGFFLWDRMAMQYFGKRMISGSRNFSGCTSHLSPQRQHGTVKVTD
jgi:hypothetical protein